MKKLGFCLMVLVGFAAVSHSAQAAITVDGSLSDWGISVQTGSIYPTISGFKQGATNYGNYAQGKDYNATGKINGFIGSHREDTNDVRTDSYHVGPHGGGQNYDTEFLGVAVQNNYLKVAILSGQRPDNGKSKYSPGDIRITTDKGRVFGIEVGNGKGTGTGGSTQGGDLGGFYTINSGGSTTGAYKTGGTNGTIQYGDAKAGQLWETTNNSSTVFWSGMQHRNGWSLETHDNLVSTQLYYWQGGSELLGTAEYYVFTGDTLPGQHSVIELSLDMNLFKLADDDTIKTIDWQPACDNDHLGLAVEFGTPPGPGGEIPEPTSILVWGLFSIASAVYGFRRRSSRSA